MGSKSVLFLFFSPRFWSDTYGCAVFANLCSHIGGFIYSWYVILFICMYSRRCYLKYMCGWYSHIIFDLKGGTCGPFVSTLTETHADDFQIMTAIDKANIESSHIHINVHIFTHISFFFFFFSFFFFFVERRWRISAQITLIHW